MARPAKEKQSTSDTTDVVRRLDAILNTLLEMPSPEGKRLSMMKRIEILNSSGLRNVEIARILGVTPAFVGVMLNVLRKRSAKGRKSSKK